MRGREGQGGSEGVEWEDREAVRGREGQGGSEGKGRTGRQ